MECEDPGPVPAVTAHPCDTAGRFESLRLSPHLRGSPRRPPLWLLPVAPLRGSSPWLLPCGSSPWRLPWAAPESGTCSSSRGDTSNPAGAPACPPTGSSPWLLPIAAESSQLCPHRCPRPHWSTHKSQALSSPSADSALIPNVDEHFKPSRHQTPRVTSPCPSPASPGHAPRSAPAPRCFDLRLSSRPPIWMPTLAQPLPATSRETSQGKPGSGRPRPALPPAAPLLGGHPLTGTSPASASAPPHADCCTNSRRFPGLNTSGPPASNQPHGFSSNRRAVACPPPAAEQTGKRQARGGKGVGAAAGT